IGAPLLDQSFVIFGGTYLTATTNAAPPLAGQTINLANGQNTATNALSTLKYTTIINTAASSINSFSTGYSVAGIGDVIGSSGVDGVPDIAIGAPNAPSGSNLSAGAVYVVSGSQLSVPTGGAPNQLNLNGGANLIFTGV